MSYTQSDFYYSDNSSSESSMHSQKYHHHSSASDHPVTPFSENRFENIQKLFHLQDGEVTTSASSTNSNDGDRGAGSSGPANGGRRRQRRKSPTVVLRLKKFRRAKANDRERHRMHLLNNALEKLRLALPAMPQDQRLTKIETLRFAHNYIFALTQAVLVIKNLRGSAAVDGDGYPQSPPPITSPIGLSCGGELERVDDKYIVTVQNVRIVLDREGNLLETNATRPATPPLDSEQHDGYEPTSNCSFVGKSFQNCRDPVFPFDANASSINFPQTHPLQPMSPSPGGNYHHYQQQTRLTNDTAHPTFVGIGPCSDGVVRHVPDVGLGHRYIATPSSPHPTTSADYNHNYPPFQHLPPKHHHHHHQLLHNKANMIMGASPTGQHGSISSTTITSEEDSVSSNVSYNNFCEESETSPNNAHYRYY
ncbi:uncharacterized protein LOC118433485 [Folsomia candida]|uniref:uncharacterized protein LOC118433485 n=1 Tax=Folsomia candida TaxID=158441 RepID=UPI001604C96D|nr:uncharacterized protein LOC118433485 [Folsomia candida]